MAATRDVLRSIGPPARRPPRPSRLAEALPRRGALPGRDPEHGGAALPRGACSRRRSASTSACTACRRAAASSCSPTPSSTRWRARRPGARRGVALHSTERRVGHVRDGAHPGRRRRRRGRAGRSRSSQGLDDARRAAAAGFRSVLIADSALLDVSREARRRGFLPADMQAKISVMLPAANPATARVLVRLGATRSTCTTDLSLAQIAAIRAVVDVPLDIYVEVPDNVGGFVRLHEIPELDPGRRARLPQVRPAQRAGRLPRRHAPRGDHRGALARARAPRPARSRPARALVVRSRHVGDRRRRPGGAGGGVIRQGTLLLVLLAGLAAGTAQARPASYPKTRAALADLVKAGSPGAVVLIRKGARRPFSPPASPTGARADR